MINFAICDDDIKYIEQVSNIIEKSIINTDFTIRTYTSGNSILEDDFSIDVLFIDIEMPGKNGIDTVKELQKKNSSLIVFFQTSYNNYITDIFRVGTFQYIQKPIDEENLKIDLKRAIDLYFQNHYKLSFKSENKLYILDIDDILYLEVIVKDVFIHTKNATYKTIGRLYEYEQILIKYGFIKSHKSYLVNVKYIYEIDCNMIKFNDKSDNIPISRKYKEEVIKSLNKYLLKLY